MADAEPFQLFDALPRHIEDALRASIQRFGVLVPITVDQHGQVLDGYHRRRIAEELRVPYDRLVRSCSDDEERREIARTLNADRRQMTEEQRREVAASLRAEGHSLRAIAGATGSSLGTIQRDLAIVSPDTIPDRVLRLNGGSYPARRPQVIARDDREQKRAQDALELIPDVSTRGASIDTKRAERIAREKTAEERRAQPVEHVTVDGGIDIRHGDFREVLTGLDGTVDAIITDPPYPREYWPLYEGLSELAAKLLKPDGILAVMTGTRLEMLDDVDARLGRYMRRRHRAVYLTPGQRWRDQIERVATGYKPILIYARTDAAGLRWINRDVFTSDGTHEADQRFHHWGQSESGFADLIRGLTEPGALVVDPFLGGGTTAVVCRDLDRKFVGCDIDPAAVATARERLA